MGTAQRGFSLLEILVAFSILALSLGVLMQIFSGSLRNAEVAHDQAQAVVLAQSLLASAGVETTLAAGEASGAVDEKYRWTLQAVPVQPEPLAGELPGATTSPPLELWQVRAQVAWGGGPGSPERSLVLTTLRVQQPPKP